MFERLRSQLTFGNVIALIALFVALGGGAYAVSKSKTKKIANKQIEKKAPGLSVANADRLHQQDSTVFQTASASDERGVTLALTGTDQTVLSTTITIPSQKTVTAVASIEAFSDGANDDTLTCDLSIAGTKGVVQSSDVNDGGANETIVPLTQSHTLGAGTHTVLAECHRNSGVVTVDDRSLSVVATG